MFLTAKAGGSVERLFDSANDLFSSLRHFFHAISTYRTQDPKIHQRLSPSLTVTTVDDKVVFAEVNVDWFFKQRRGCDKGAKSEELAEYLGLLICDAGADAEILPCGLEGPEDWCTGDVVI